MSKRPLWETHTIPEVIRALLEWGNGSGEELFDYLTQNGLNSDEARSVIDDLERTLRA